MSFSAPHKHLCPLIKDTKIKLRPIFEIYPLEISIMTLENHLNNHPYDYLKPMRNLSLKSLPRGSSIIPVYPSTSRHLHHNFNVSMHGFLNKESHAPCSQK